MYHVSFSSIIITKLRGALTVVWAHLQMGSNRFCKQNKLFFYIKVTVLGAHVCCLGSGARGQA